MNIYDTIYKEFQRGLKAREKCPLNNGAYKLSEVAHYTVVIKDNIEQFIDCRKQRRPLWSSHAADQASIYIKSKPKGLSFALGYYVLPAIKQLHADGVPRDVLDSHLPIVDKKIVSALEAAAEAEWELKVGKIKEEYRRYDYGDSILFKLCDRYTEVIKYGLGLYPYSKDPYMGSRYLEVFANGS